MSTHKFQGECLSGDYRIGTRYPDEHILDLIKTQAMQVPFLKGPIYIASRGVVTVQPPPQAQI